MHFTQTWHDPPATSNVISRNHSSQFSPYLFQNARKRYENSY